MVKSSVLVLDSVSVSTVRVRCTVGDVVRVALRSQVTEKLPVLSCDPVRLDVLDSVWLPFASTAWVVVNATRATITTVSNWRRSIGRDDLLLCHTSTRKAQSEHKFSKQAKSKYEGPHN